MPTPYTLNKIQKELERLYSSGKIFIAYMEGGDITPYSIRFRVKQKEIQENYSSILKDIQRLQRAKLPLVYREYQFKAIGLQRLPSEVLFETVDSMLSTIDRIDEYYQFVKIYDETVARYPTLKPLFLKQPRLILKHQDVWSRLYLVCGYFLAYPLPAIYIRELSIVGVDTKFIERHRSILDMMLIYLLDTSCYDSDIIQLSNGGFERKYGLRYPQPLVRFRILDSSLYIAGMSDISLPLDQFAKLHLDCDSVYIVENQITTLSFPDLPKSIVIFGSGYSVGVLVEARWLQDREIYYWGDIDSDGFAILSQMRSHLPHTISLLMDKETLERHIELNVPESNNTHKSLPNLTHTERVVYQSIVDGDYGDSFRLEQERIPFEWVLQRILSI